jgi:hypothetical protein
MEPSRLTLVPCRFFLWPWRLTLELWSHPGAVEAQHRALEAYPGYGSSPWNHGSNPGSVETDTGAKEAHPGALELTLVQ